MTQWVAIKSFLDGISSPTPLATGEAVRARTSIESPDLKWQNKLERGKMRCDERYESMHNGASNEIKEIKVFKKCPKVEPYCMPIFDPNRFEPF